MPDRELAAMPDADREFVLSATHDAETFDQEWDDDLDWAASDF